MPSNAQDVAVHVEIPWLAATATPVDTARLSQHTELVGLVAQVEALEAQRIESLSRLARLRGVSLTSLMDELGLHPPEDG
jgi:hypothetical protein